MMYKHERVREMRGKIWSLGAHQTHSIEFVSGTSSANA